MIRLRGSSDDPEEKSNQLSQLPTTKSYKKPVSPLDPIIKNNKTLFVIEKEVNKVISCNYYFFIQHILVL